MTGKKYYTIHKYYLECTSTKLNYPGANVSAAIDIIILSSPAYH